MKNRFVNITNVTREQLVESCKLWVVDSLPDAEKKSEWEAIAYAEEGCRTYDIIGQWVESSNLGKAPRSTQARTNLLMDSVKKTPGQHTFIITEAHLLRPEAIDKMHLLSEEGITVFLEGDVSIIDAKIRECSSFFQRALFGVHVKQL